MALSMRRLVRNAKKDFRMNLIAGADGLDHKVNWVHMIEDYEVADFLRGNELVLTTGIGNVISKENMMFFVKTLHQNRVSGVVFNIGPYIESIPKTIMDYCNENHLPLFTLPWEIHLVDVTRSFCQMLIESEMKQKSLTALVKDYLFRPDERDTLYEDLTMHGFLQHLNYCILNIGLQSIDDYAASDKEWELLHDVIDHEFAKSNAPYVLFKNEQNYIVIAAGIKTVIIREAAQRLSDKHISQKVSISIAVSSNRDNLLSLPQNFELTNKLYHLAENLNQSLMFYDDNEMNKLLLSISDKKIMRGFINATLLPLREYDEGNGSNYVEFIQTYMEYGGNIQQMANDLYVHRNTIHYKINKIKEISGINLSDMDDLIRVGLCLKIQKML